MTAAYFVQVRHGMFWDSFGAYVACHTACSVAADLAMDLTRHTEAGPGTRAFALNPLVRVVRDGQVVYTPGLDGVRVVDDPRAAQPQPATA